MDFRQLFHTLETIAMTTSKKTQDYSQQYVTLFTFSAGDLFLNSA
jgi:hypothetical protein